MVRKSHIDSTYNVLPFFRLIAVNTRAHHTKKKRQWLVIAVEQGLRPSYAIF